MEAAGSSETLLPTRLHRVTLLTIVIFNPLPANVENMVSP
jgi:hypothetical protein